MQPKAPSRTAFAAAAHRAAHQVLEHGGIFTDPLALTILGRDADAAIHQARAEPARRRMRIFIAMRSKLAEAALARSVEKDGVRQLVVLGAGLDTFAYRSPFGHRARVFEVDHPATQSWKRGRLTETGIPIPEWLSFVPVDFERDDLLGALFSAGLDPAQRTFFTWLGVVPYLTEAAVFSTLGRIGAIGGGSEVAFDYADPPDTFAPELLDAHKVRAEAVAAIGEPWLSHFDPPVLHGKLRALGFEDIDDFGPPRLAACFGFDGAESLPDRGGHVVLASTR